MSFLKIQSPATSLYSGLSASGTSMVLAKYPVDLDGNKLTMGAFGVTPQCTVDPKISGYEEIIGFTNIVDNGDGTATFTGLSRDLASSNLATPGTGKQHGAGAIVILSWNPQDVARLMNLEDAQTVAGVKTFSSFPITPSSAPTTNYQVANKKYMDDAIIAGGVDAAAATKGISKLSVDPVLNTNPIAVGQNDPKFVEYYVDTGAANAYVITPVISIGAYATGQRFSFKAVNANTTASTLNINGLGAIAIKKLSATALIANDILAGQIVLVEYDGTNFQMLSQIGNAPFVATLDTDGTLSANSDTRVPSQKAVKTFVNLAKIVSSTIFETATRFTSLVIGGSNTFGDGLEMDTTNTTTSCAGITWRMIGQGSDSFAKSPTFSAAMVLVTIGTTGSAYFGIGSVTVNGSGHTFTTKHAGFKIIISDSVATLYATQGDGSNETASSALTTIAAISGIEVFLRINGTSSIDYYWSISGGAWSAAINLATHVPTALNSFCQISVSNEAVATQNILYAYAASYSR